MKSVDEFAEKIHNVIDDFRNNVTYGEVIGVLELVKYEILAESQEVSDETEGGAKSG